MNKIIQPKKFGKRFNILVRPTKDWISHIVMMEKALFPDPFSRSIIRQQMESANKDFFVVSHGNKLAGYGVVFYRRNSNKARLYNIAIHPKWHGIGLAQCLEAEMERNVILRGCQEIYCEVRIDNRKSIKFFKKLGFRLFGYYVRYYDDGCNALRLRKDLSFAGE